MNPLERATRAADAFQRRHLVPSFAFGVVKKFGDDNGGILAANLAYSAFLSLFPLLLLAITITGLLLGPTSSAEATIRDAIATRIPLAGAVLLEPAEAPGILSTHLHADGTYWDLLYSGGGTDPAKPRRAITMTGNDVFKIAVNTLCKSIEEALAANGLTCAALDWLVPHQANLRIIQATARRLELPMERVITTVQDHGNTSAASVPLALDVGVRSGKIRRGDLILLEAFGGGFTWGSALIRY
jgi:3-oxoacyl-(acyl-carrier-protein) synthase III